jgi:hypothetical protein
MTRSRRPKDCRHRMVLIDPELPHTLIILPRAGDRGCPSEHVQCVSYTAAVVDCSWEAQTRLLRVGRVARDFSGPSFPRYFLIWTDRKLFGFDIRRYVVEQAHS